MASALAEGSDSAKAENPWFADDWHFAVLIREGENVRVHLDGGEKPVLTGKAGKAANEVLLGQGLEGRLDEITVWDRGVEPELIAKLTARGPVGLVELTTYKNIVRGKGTLRP